MEHYIAYLGTYANSIGFYMCISPGRPEPAQCVALENYCADIAHDGLVVIYSHDDAYHVVLLGNITVPPHTIVPMLKVLLEISDYNTSNGLRYLNGQLYPHRLHVPGLTRQHFLRLFADLSKNIE